MPRVIPSPQWEDTGGQKEPTGGDNARVPRLEIDAATTYLDVDGSNNLTFTDDVTGTKTLAQLVGGGSGDVTGPGSSTDNAIVRFDSTTGKIIQDYTSNPPTISDTGDLNIDGDIDCENIVVSGNVDGVDVSAHASRHLSAGADSIKLDDLAAPDDTTDLDFSITLHGLVPKGTNVGNFLKDDGTWAAAAGSGDVTGPGSSIDNAIARFHLTTGKIIQDYTSNPPTISDTGDITVDGDLTADNIITAGNVDGIDVSAHAVANTGVHGIGASTFATAATLATHAAIKSANAVLGHVIVETGSLIDVDVDGKLTLGAHASTHQNTGGDEISVADLSGLLADDQHVLDAEVTPLITDVNLTTTDVTTGDTSTTKHGLAPKVVAPAAGLINVMGVANGETALTNKPLFDATTPATETVGGAGAVGTAVTSTRRDHQHPITNPAIDTLAAATDITTRDTSTTAHGLVPKVVAPAATYINVMGVANGETALTNKALFDATTPVIQAHSDSAATGSAVVAARRDHVHGMPAAAGGGDVTGPASSTDNMIARHDSTTGKILLDYTSNPPTISDSGDVNVDGDLDVEAIIATSIAVPTITSAANIALTATDDVVIPANVGITFGTGEKIEGDNTDLTITSGGAINLTAVTDIVIPANVGVTFGTGEKIEGDNTDLTVTSGGAINLTAVTDIVVPANVGVAFGTGEKIEGNNTDLTLTSGADIALTATGDINIPANVGLTLGDDGEKIEGDGTDLTIESSNILNITAPGNMLFAENSAVEWDNALSADGKYCGIVTKQFNGGATIPFGEVVYLKAADSEWYQAKADVTATSGAVMVGICVLATTDAGACTVLLSGKVRADAKFPTFTISAPVFISAATAGILTSTAPTGTTNFVVRIIGHAGTGDEVYIHPDNSYVELA